MCGLELLLKGVCRKRGQMADWRTWEREVRCLRRGDPDAEVDVDVDVPGGLEGEDAQRGPRLLGR